MNSGFNPFGARRVADIAEALCRAVGNAIRLGFLQTVMAMVICRRIRRVQALLLALEARLLSGKPAAGVRLPGSRDRVARAAVGSEGCGVRLPRRFGWLCGLVPGEAACFAGQLRVVLAEPGMAALLSASPKAVRIVGPLCWMLGISAAEFVPCDSVSPVVVLAQTQVVPEPVVDSVDASARLAQRSAGMGWVRFIPT